MNYKGNLIYTALVPLIKETVRMQLSPDGKQQRSCISDKNWLRQYCTIKLHAPRQMGHSQAVQKFLKDAPDTQALLVVENHGTNGILINQKKSIEEAFNQFRGVPLSTLAIDNASMLTKEQINEVYEELVAFVAGRDTVFVLLLLG